MTNLLFIAVGGSMGALLRYMTHSGIQSLHSGPFPIGTLVVNTVGCVAIGFLAAYFSEAVSLSPEVRLGLFVGLLGGFTTFSTYGLETLALAEAGALGLAALNFGLSNALGITGVWAGLRLASPS